MKKIKGNNGFTLIEVLVAMSVVSLIALTLFNVINTSIKTNAKNERDIDALNVAQTIVEDIRNQIKNTDDDTISLDGSDIEFATDEESKSKSYQVDKDNFIYDVNVYISRELSYEDRYMYELAVFVKSENDKLSKKESSITTKIFGK